MASAAAVAAVAAVVTSVVVVHADDSNTVVGIHADHYELQVLKENEVVIQ